MLAAAHTDLDAVMDRVLRVSASTGSMSAAAVGEEIGRWAYVAGARSRGRFPLQSTWEVDPLTTAAARARRTQILRAMPGWRRLPLRERYVAYRAVTRDLMAA